MKDNKMEDNLNGEITIKSDKKDLTIILACYHHEAGMFMPMMLTITKTKELIILLQQHVKELE